MCRKQEEFPLHHQPTREAQDTKEFSRELRYDVGARRCAGILFFAQPSNALRYGEDVVGEFVDGFFSGGNRAVCCNVGWLGWAVV